MKKLGLGKKDKDGSSAPDPGEDQKRSRLFGGSKKDKAGGSQASNPYAQSNLATDPYARPQDPYARPEPSLSASSGYGGMGSPAYADSGRTSTASQPPGYDKATLGQPPAPGGMREKSPVPPGGYGGGGARYGNQGYGGNSNAYGDNRFGGPSNAPAPPSGGASGGYGGMSKPKEYDDRGRDQLFGGAKDRAQERKAQEPQPQQSGLPPEDMNNQSGGGYAGMENGGNYGDGAAPYRERQLTAEEEEEEDVAATKDQIRTIKREDVSSTRNALRIAAQAEETGRATLERLGAQGERIHNTENNLDLASNQNRLAEDKARELKHLNRSMWAMQVNNPFTKGRRADEADRMVMESHRREREQRDATRAAAWSTQNRKAETQRDLRGPGGAPVKKGNLAERSKYQFEADSEDEAMEDEIDQNLELLGGAAGRLNQLGRAMGKEVDSQNKHIDRIVEKTDRVDDQIALNRARLDRIR